MRRIAKLSLLLAPLVLSSASGCATSGSLAKSDQLDSRMARIDRLLTVAVDYENSGRQDLAMSVYQHVLAQHPENSYARERYDLLADSGVSPGELPQNKRKLRDLLAPSTPEALLAASRPQTKTTSPTAASPAAAPASSESVPPVVRQKEEATLAETTKPFPAIETASAEKPGSEKSWTGEPPVKQPAINDENWNVTVRSMADGRGADEKPAEPAAVPTGSKEESSQPQPEQTHLLAVAESPKGDSWATTDLTRFEKPKTPVGPVDAAWERTRLVTLCEGLPEELIPRVEQLESRDPLIRIQGLQALAEQGSQARPASVAVHALLQDSEPVVAVYAASTLRDIAKDAWSSVQTLSSYLKHDDQQIVRLSAYLLGQMGPEAMDAVPALESVRDSSDLLSSLHAAEALTHIAPADRRSFNKLNEALAGEDATVRWFAAVSLGTVSSDCEKDAAAALVKALRDSEPQVRAAACLSLGGLGKHAAIAISDLEEAARSDSSEVKNAAETALACLRG